jgi:hypothetical protein
MWNGVTTLHWCQLVEKLIIDNSHWGQVVHFGFEKPISKHKLLCIISNVYGKELEIEEVQAASSVNQSLIPTIPCADIETQLQELHEMK